MKKAVRVVDTRQFLRHPLDVPLRCTVKSVAEQDAAGLRNISDGGAAFYSSHKYRKGQAVEMTFPVFKTCPIIRGKIIWAMPDKDVPGQFINGLKYADARDRKLIRLVEQICHIMSYRVMQEHLTGKVLSAEEAAKEWIGKYADSFPT
jgi:hypothetical protein